MNDTVYSIEELKSKIGKIAREYGIKKVALFGSYSNGTATPTSDIDLLIDKGELKGFIRFNAFKHAIEDATEKSVDLITYTSLRNSSLMDCIGNEVLLYG